MYLCLVCGYDKLDKPLYLESGSPNFNICPCCGFQSGYDDLLRGKTVEDYRDEWLSNGATWLNKKKRPTEWNMQEQLKNIGVSKINLTKNDG